MSKLNEIKTGNAQLDRILDEIEAAFEVEIKAVSNRLAYADSQDQYEVAARELYAANVGLRQVRQAVCVTLDYIVKGLDINTKKAASRLRFEPDQPVRMKAGSKLANHAEGLGAGKGLTFEARIEKIIDGDYDYRIRVIDAWGEESVILQAKDDELEPIG